MNNKTPHSLSQEVTYSKVLLLHVSLDVRHLVRYAFRLYRFPIYAIIYKYKKHVLFTSLNYLFLLETYHKNRINLTTSNMKYFMKFYENDARGLFRTTTHHRWLVENSHLPMLMPSVAARHFAITVAWNEWTFAYFSSKESLRGD